MCPQHTHIKVYLADLPCLHTFKSSINWNCLYINGWSDQFLSMIHLLPSMKDISQLEWWMCDSRWNSANCNWTKSLDCYIQEVNWSPLHTRRSFFLSAWPMIFYTTELPDISDFPPVTLFSSTLPYMWNTTPHSTVAELCCISDCLSFSIVIVAYFVWTMSRNLFFVKGRLLQYIKYCSSAVPWYIHNTYIINTHII